MEPLSDIPARCREIEESLPRNRFRIECVHVLERLSERYRDSDEDPARIVARVMNILENNTPDDWRFTESPASRFFITDEKSAAKFMGMTYRDSGKIHEIVRFIRETTTDVPAILSGSEEFARLYEKEVTNPELAIIHHIRTVYPKGSKGDIPEERNLYEKAREAITHAIPIASRKIAARPNAVVGIDGILWVRQHMNWMGAQPGGKEYYLFQPLTRDGVNKNEFKVYSHDENGNLKEAGKHSLDCGNLCRSLREVTSAFREDCNIRSESYWKVPTYLDLRFTDLDYLERTSAENARKNRQPVISASELVELYFLRQIVERVRARLHKK